MHRLRGDAATATEAHRGRKHLSSSEMRRLRGGAAVTTEASGGQRLRPLHQRGGGRGRGAGAGGGGLFTSKVLEIEDVL